MSSTEIVHRCSFLITARKSLTTSSLHPWPGFTIFPSLEALWLQHWMQQPWLPGMSKGFGILRLVRYPFASPKTAETCVRCEVLFLFRSTRPTTLEQFGAPALFLRRLPSDALVRGFSAPCLLGMGIPFQVQPARALPTNAILQSNSAVSEAQLANRSAKSGTETPKPRTLKPIPKLNPEP